MPAKQYSSGNPFDEGNAAVVLATFFDAADNPPPLDKAAIVSILATLKTATTGVVINERLDQDVLDDNDGTVALNGTLTLRLSGLNDMIIVDSTQSLEQHRLTLVVTYNKTGGGTDQITQEILFWVKNSAEI
jgi:hypothetical protein